VTAGVLWPSADAVAISAVFSGASGTGKTMDAEVLSRELALHLHRSGARCFRSTRRPTDWTPTSSRMNVAGGNIAVGAAFLAAEAGEAVRSTQILRAAEREYAQA
jgi:hypothetical protein